MNFESSLETSILGFKFSAPFFISPCASAGMISPVAERGLVGGAVLEMKAFFICEIENARVTADQVQSRQISVLNNIAAYVNIFQEIEQMGAKAIAITVNSAGDPRPAACDAMRYPPNVNLDSVQRWAYTTWDYDRGLQSLTPLPIFSKGIETIEDARRAVEGPRHLPLQPPGAGPRCLALADGDRHGDLRGGPRGRQAGGSVRASATGPF
ncbi:uncharacterized protein L3040_007823 [Drepanopeziza brunnea f. sp. 'multigermtubi']|uniref:uncharacterized protein n=1 Tax=Drepanopeziza brunnea f. sp. 'multigermtubi' TaxID=698441 RepID=UPI00239DE86A|nr:hypothetical protein L3040_007823 [Drepanopeziza brunnea f. sp. 'multigermtubi']